MKRVLIMAGGTGGHVFPGLAVAKYLREKGVEVHWLGTHQGLEARVIPLENIPLHHITISGIRGKGAKALLAAPWKILQAIQQSLCIIKNLKPDAVIGMGGFVSGPGGFASWLSRIPLVIHEQNAKAGLTNKILARFAKRVLEGFPHAFQDTFPQNDNVLTIGNPVRSEIEHLPPPSERFNSSKNNSHFRLLVLGGSLGAQAINETVPNALALLQPHQRPEIWHQSGEKHFEPTQKIYKYKGIAANVTPFIQDMAQAYQWADVVVCRAGALTVAELCAVGLGAVLVPFPFAVDDHQTANAQFMVKNEAALCVQQTELTNDRLADIMRQFSQLPERRFAMAEAAYQLRKVNVAAKFYEVLYDMVGK